MNKDSKDTTTGSILLIISVAIGFAFLALPWIDLRLGKMSGLDLAQELSNNEFKYLTLWLVPSTAFFACVEGFQILFGRKQLTLPDSIIMIVAGCITLYPFYAIYSDLDNSFASGLISFGFWIALIGNVVLIIMGFSAGSEFRGTYGETNSSLSPDSHLKDYGGGFNVVVVRGGISILTAYIISRSTDIPFTQARKLLKRLPSIILVGAEKKMAESLGSIISSVGAVVEIVDKTPDNT